MMRHYRCQGGCGAEWCWICYRVGTCSDYNCRAKNDEYRHPTNEDTTTRLNRKSPDSAPGGSAPCTMGPPARAFEVDHSLPITKIRLTLHDGQRRELLANEDHTVGDVCDYCSLLAGGVPTIILSGFPPRALGESGKTLREAGVLNSAVIARQVGAKSG